MHQGLIEKAGPALNQLSDDDRHWLQQFGQGPRQVVTHDQIQHAFEDHAAARPSAIAVEHLGDVISYGDLDRRANHVAALLIERGVRPGDNVGLFVYRSIPMIIGILGALKAGAAYVPQDVRTSPAAHLQHVADTAAIRVILTMSDYADRVPSSAGTTVIALDKLPEPTMAPPLPVREGGACYVLFTSGTTGWPNGVVVTHRNVCNLLLTEPGNLGIRPGQRVTQLLNIAFDMAAWEILACLSHGGTLVIRGRDIAATAATADVIIATPSILSTIDPAQCRQIKVVAVAGEPCPRSLADQWARICTFYNGCGPTEVTIVNTMQRHDPAAMKLTIGRPTPNNTVYVLDEHCRPVPIGEVGEMWAGGECVSAGYIGNPELTAERYRPDPFSDDGGLMFRTRDLGRWTPNGELEHFGRTDDQVKIRGFRVELDSVSAVLEAMPGCTRAATIKWDDRTLVSFVSAHDISPDAACEAIAQALPYYCVPAVVHVLDELPRTDRGKIDKARLLDLVGYDQRPEAVAA